MSGLDTPLLVTTIAEYNIHDYEIVRSVHTVWCAVEFRVSSSHQTGFTDLPIRGPRIEQFRRF